MPCWHEEPYPAFANEFVAYAVETPSVQSAIEHLYGPTVHLPALLWYIWHYVHLDNHFVEREDERSETRSKSAEIGKIKGHLLALIERQTKICEFIGGRRDKLAILLRSRRYSPIPEEKVEAEVSRIARIGEKLTECIEELETSGEQLWSKLEQPITNRKTDKFHLYLIFHIVKEMTGNRNWQAIATVMNGIAHTQGHSGCYDADTLARDFKTLRKDHPDYTKRWIGLIERNRMDFHIAFLAYLRREGIDVPAIMRVEDAVLPMFLPLAVASKRGRE